MAGNAREPPVETVVPRSDTSPRPQVRRRVLALLAFALATTLVASGAPAPSTVAGDELSEAKADRRALDARVSDQQALVARLERTQKSLRGKIATTSAALDETAADLKVARRETNALRAEITVVEQDYQKLVSEVDALEAELARTEAAEAVKRNELRERKAQLGERIRAAYEASLRSPFEAIVSGASFADLLVEASSQLDAGEQDRALAEQIALDREALLVLASTLDTQRTQAVRLQQTVALQKAELDDRLVELRAAERRLRELERRTAAVLARQRAAYEELGKDKARLRASIAASERAQRKLDARIDRLLQAEARKGGIPSTFSGSMQWPLRGVISQDYGCTGFPWEPPRGNCANFHNGIDIVRPEGTPVRAAAAGKVLFVGYNPYDDPRDPAWIVIIAHSSGLQTWYAHMQPRRPVRAGQQVSAGQVIGYVGNTGRSTGAHLDWRVMRNGDWVNPRLFL